MAPGTAVLEVFNPGNDRMDENPLSCPVESAVAIWHDVAK